MSSLGATNQLEIGGHSGRRARRLDAGTSAPAPAHRHHPAQILAAVCARKMDLNPRILKPTPRELRGGVAMGLGNYR